MKEKPKTKKKTVVAKQPAKTVIAKPAKKAKAAVAGPRLHKKIQTAEGWKRAKRKAVGSSSLR